MHSKEIGWYHVDGFLIIFPNYIANFQQWSQYSLIVLLHSKPKQTNVIQHYWTRKSKTTPENIFGSQGCITHPQYEYRCIFPKATGSFSCTVKYEIYFFFCILKLHFKFTNEGMIWQEHMSNFFVKFHIDIGKIILIRLVEKVSLLNGKVRSFALSSAFIREKELKMFKRSSQTILRGC